MRHAHALPATMGWVASILERRGLARSLDQIFLRHFDDVSRTTAEKGFGRIKSHTEDRLHVDLRRKEKLHRIRHDIKQRRAGMSEPCFDRAFEIVGTLDPAAVEAD